MGAWIRQWECMINVLHSFFILTWSPPAISVMILRLYQYILQISIKAKQRQWDCGSYQRDLEVGPCIMWCQRWDVIHHTLTVVTLYTPKESRENQSVAVTFSTTVVVIVAIYRGRLLQDNKKTYKQTIIQGFTLYLQTPVLKNNTRIFSFL